MAQPVRHVLTPDHLAVQLHIAIQQIGRVHDLVNVEGVVGQDDGAIGTAQLKGL